MIFYLGGLVLGAALGVLGASRRGGTRLDLLQWGAVGAILGLLIGVFVLIAIQRNLT